MYEIPVSRNKFIVYDDYAEMIIVNRRIGEVKTKVDIEDIPRLQNIMWIFNSQCGYVTGVLRDNKYSLQRFLISTPDDKYTDHINGDKLDNRKQNLRVVTPQQNCWNTPAMGVGIDKRSKKKIKYRAYIQVNKKYITLGTHDTYEEAVKARQKAEEKYYGQYSRTSKFSYKK